MRFFNEDVVPEEMKAEALNGIWPYFSCLKWFLKYAALAGLVVRVAYRLRSLSEQSPFDCSTFCYVSPFLSAVVRMVPNSEQEDEVLELIALSVELFKIHGAECEFTSLQSNLHASYPRSFYFSSSCGPSFSPNASYPRLALCYSKASNIREGRFNRPHYNCWSYKTQCDSRWDRRSDPGDGFAGSICADSQFAMPAGNTLSYNLRCSFPDYLG